MATMLDQPATKHPARRYPMPGPRPTWADRDEDDRPRSGTTMRDSTGAKVPGEFNAATGQPMGANDSFGKGRTSDAAWAQMFPGSPTAMRQRGEKVPSAPTMFANTRQQQGPSGIVLPDTRQPGPGYSAGDVGKFVAANPMGAASFQTPWGPVARGGVATPQAPAITPNKTFAVTPATPTNVGPAIGSPGPTGTPAGTAAAIMASGGAASKAAQTTPGAVAPKVAAAPVKPWYDQAAQSVTGNPTLRDTYTPRGLGRSMETTRKRAVAGMGKVNQAVQSVTPTVPGAARAAANVGEAAGRGVVAGARGIGDLAEGAGLPVPWWMRRPAKGATPTAQAAPKNRVIDNLTERFGLRKPTKRPEAQPTY